MKKLLLALLAITSLCLTGCNADMSLGSYSFHYVHVQMYGMTQPEHLKVNTWKSDNGGIELKVVFNNKETTLLLGDGTYMMYDTYECPVCGEVEYR